MNGLESTRTTRSRAGASTGTPPPRTRPPPGPSTGCRPPRRSLPAARCRVRAGPARPTAAAPPKTCRAKALVDHDDPRSVRPDRTIEQASAAEAQPHHVEVARADHLYPRSLQSPAAGRSATSTWVPRKPPMSGRPEDRPTASTGETRQRAEPPRSAVPPPSARPGLGRSDLSARSGLRVSAATTSAGSFERDEPHEAAQEQPGADQQDDREGRLGGRERRAGPFSCKPPVACGLPSFRVSTRLCSTTGTPARPRTPARRRPTARG